eukprot:CAMPEP_0185450710 /NCGR_PEP_ID=MMETSP1365-20130426/63490_1 /TAXON_ID=38817 /ORGANISM="Gephyrocapsa oceanica, Strain RCC1303" /LENGTH=113 /DNA_ID=CAMNT_0028056813 /DNA_START=50 /DNA_END=387 /DNA_ORIENTATION=+
MAASSSAESGGSQRPLRASVSHSAPRRLRSVRVPHVCEFPSAAPLAKLDTAASDQRGREEGRGGGNEAEEREEPEQHRSRLPSQRVAKRRGGGSARRDAKCVGHAPQAYIWRE